MNKIKLLVIPSWYPSETDRIIGSFFQEQSKLLSQKFDVKVLHIRFLSRPSLKNGWFKNIFFLFKFFCKLPFVRMQRIELPDDEIFKTPPLFLYSKMIWGPTRRNIYKIRKNSYLNAFELMKKDGWVPDIIHAHSVNLAGIASLLINKKHKIPYVLTEHGPFALLNYPKFMRKDIRKSFQMAEDVLSLGYDQIRQFSMSNIDIEPAFIYNFVDENVFNSLCNDYLPGEPLKIISIGTATYYKDHHTLLKSLLVLKNKNIPFKATLIGLKIFGDKLLYEKTLDYINNNGLSDDVFVVDKVDRSEVSGYLTQNNVFLMTSIAETFAVSIAEAMASGLFIVTTNHGGGTVDIMKSETGVVVPIKDYQKIAETLEMIYNGGLIFYPNQIRDHIISICGSQAFSQRISSFYEKVIRARNNAIDTVS